MAALGVGLACQAGVAHAQPVSFLRVDAEDAADARLAIVEVDPARELEAEAGDVLERASWLYGLGDHGSHNYSAALTAEDREALRPGDLLSNSQAVLFGMDLRERIVLMEAEDFGLLAARAGVEWAAPDGVTDVRVRRIESGKTLARMSRPEGRWASPIATAKRGERAEIRALFDPSMLTPGSVLPVRVYVEGDGAKGATVIATHVQSGESWRVAADEKAIAILTLDRLGSWRVEFHVAMPAVDDPDADWVVYSGTYTFEAIGGAE